MRIDGNGDLKHGRLSVRWIFVRFMLASLALILFLLLAFVTAIECRIAPAFILNRSDQAIERLTVSVVYLDYPEGIWSGPELWSGRLEAGAVRIVDFPMRRIEGYSGEGRMAYSGLWSDGRPIPVAYGPGYLTTFPDNHALVLEVNQDSIAAATVAERLAPIISGSPHSGLSWFVDQAAIILFCWVTWLFEPVGLLSVVLVAAIIILWVWRRRTQRESSI